LARFFMVTPELESLAARMRMGILRQGRYLVTAPSEMAQLGDLAHALEFARRNGWMLVCHLGGENYEFFEATRSRNQVLF
jgi:hypothetical protein